MAARSSRSRKRLRRRRKVDRPLTIAVDAMGGDHAPAAAVQGALRAHEQGVPAIILVGDKAALTAELGPAGLPEGVTIRHCSEVVGMDEPPGQGLRRKPDSSINVCALLVRDQAADGMISAGNSGAAMGAALLRMGTVPGVERPAIATLIPSKQGRVVLLDAGANTDCKPSHLLQFARMGAVYAEVSLGIARPTIGLLSIGEEDTKGNELTKIANRMMAASLETFRGNVEGKDMVNQAVDVVVCDGFVGNVVLKTGEGFAELFAALLKAELARFPRLLEDQDLLQALRHFERKIDYAEYGGALLLGVRGVCVISHGRSGPKAIARAVEVAHEAAAGRVPERIAAAFTQGR